MQPRVRPNQTRLVILHGVTRLNNTLAIYFKSLTLRQILKVAIYSQQVL